jgi:hypothetical protein
METLPGAVVVHDLSSQLIYIMLQKDVNERDTRNGFSSVSQILNGAQQPMFVVVDIRTNPDFPLASAVKAALEEGVYCHPMLQEWLVIGDNPLARVTEFLLKSATGRSNVRWFSTEAQLADYVALRQLEHTNETVVV